MSTQPDAPYRPDITKASDSKLAWVKILVMGPSGSGKTTFGATAKNALTLLVEKQGLQSIKKVNPDHPVIQIESWEHLGRTVKWIQKSIQDLEMGRITKKEFPYDTFVLDSFQDAQGLLEKSLMKGSKDKIRLSRDEYGLLGTRSLMLLNSLRDLDRNIVVLVSSEEWQDGEELKVRPSGVGKQAPSKMGFRFNVVAYAFKRIPEQGGRPEYFLLTDAHDKFLTKGDVALEPIEIQNCQHWIDKMLSTDTAGAIKPAQEGDSDRPVPPEPKAPPKPKESGKGNRKTAGKGGAK